jgi:hypothetical protein
MLRQQSPRAARLSREVEEHAEAAVLSVTFAISAQSPEMERHPDDQPEHDDRNGDLKPDNSA